MPTQKVRLPQAAARGRPVRPFAVGRPYVTQRRGSWRVKPKRGLDSPPEAVCPGLAAAELSSPRRPAACGRVEPKRGSDCSPETSRSEGPGDEIFETAGTVGLWPRPSSREGQLSGSSIAAMAMPARQSVRAATAAPPNRWTGPIGQRCAKSRHTVDGRMEAAVAEAIGLIEPPEPADTQSAPEPQPRCGAASACRAPKSRLGQQSVRPHR